MDDTTHTKLSRWCEGIIEAGWLFALIVTPLFFNIHSDRVFEPDKLSLLRSIAVVMSVAWLVWFVDGQRWRDLSRLSWRHERSVLRTPLVLPTLLVVLSYLVSTIFSIAPRTSLWGSYQRMQGTYSTLSYIVIFALVLTFLRRREQLERLITLVIVVSIPISFYPMLQKFGHDPLPWGADVSRRVSGHMGNAIFIAAYLIMVFPLTAVRVIDSFSSILLDEELSWTDVVRASIYILTLALQLLAIYWSQSRGPLIGLGLGMFAFILLMLVLLRELSRRDDDGSQSIGQSILWPLVYVGLTFGALILADILTPSLGGRNSFLVWIGIIGLLVLSIFILAGSRRGWRWLWLSWILVVFTVGLQLIIFNFSVQFPEQTSNTPLVGSWGDTFEEWKRVPTIGRLGRMLDSSAGTSRVRILIWEGVVDLITPHDPLRAPTGEFDSLNALRPLIGYGPESMYVAYNRFYPPELALIEARNASPDRSHNETFDALVITGLFGFVAWQILYLSAFYYGFRQLGVVNSGRDRILLIALWILGGAVATAVAISSGGAVYFGVALPFGSILGLIVYLVYYALVGSRTESENPYTQNNVLMAGLIAVLVAFYVEIHFGIAIASTRTYSFIFMAVMVVLGTMLKADNEAVVSETADQSARKSSSRARRSRGGQGLGLSGGLVAVVLTMCAFMATLAYNYVNLALRAGEGEGFRTAADVPGALEIIQRSFLTNPRNEFIDSPFVLILIVMAWLFGGLLFITEAQRDGRLLGRDTTKTNPAKSMISPILLGVSAILGIVGFVVNQSSDVVSLTRGVGMIASIVWAIAALAGAGLLLMRNDAIVRNAGAAVAGAGILLSLPLIISSTWWIALLNVLVCLLALYTIHSGVRGRVIVPLLWILIPSFFLFLLYAISHASLINSSFIAPEGLQGLERRIFEAERVSRYVANYFILFFFLLLGSGTALGWQAMGGERKTGNVPSYVALALGLILSVWTINTTNYNTVKADMTYKRGRPYDQRGSQLQNQANNNQLDDAQRAQSRQGATESWEIATAVYERVTELAPNEDFYYLFLGRAYLEQTELNRDNREELLSTAETRLKRAQEINPFNTDHTANLARLNARWAGYEQNSNPAVSKEKTELSAGYYQDALTLSPQNSVIRNEYSGLLSSVGDDCGNAISLLEDSIQIDPFFANSYVQLSDTYRTCAIDGDSEPNLAYYQEAIDVVDSAMAELPERELTQTAIDSLDTRILAVALAYLQGEEYDLAVQTAEDVLRRATSDVVRRQAERIIEEVNSGGG